MRSRWLLLIVLAVLSAPSATVADDDPAPSLDDILTRLELSAGRAVPYEQVRVSGLLAEPVVTHGTITWRPPAYLRKTVTDAAGGERALEVEGDRVRIAGPDGERTRALDRMPAVRMLMGVLRAASEADAELLRERYDARLSGDRRAWTIALRAPAGSARRHDKGDRRDPGQGAAVRLAGERETIRRIRLESPALGRVEISLEAGR